jgi:hypothetical protein
LDFLLKSNDQPQCRLKYNKAKDILHKNLRKLMVIFLHDPPEFENFGVKKKETFVEKIKTRALCPTQFS